MKPKFIRIISPATLAIIGLLDIAVLYYAIYSVRNLIVLYRKETKMIIFAIGVFLALILGVMVTIQIFKNGIKLYEDKVEFTNIDGENTFNYSDISEVETKKDTKASLVKGFNERQSKIILNMKDERVITIDIGLTTVATMERVANSIRERMLEEKQVEAENEAPKAEQEEENE